MIAATRLRKGSTNSARGAARLVADALATARRAARPGCVVVRADSAFYGHDVIAACRRAGARFSITARHDPAVRTAIASIDEQAWTPIQYPNAVFDDDEQRVGLRRRGRRDRATPRSPPAAGRAGHRPADRAPGPPAQPDHVPAEQGELFAVYRYHAVFTDTRCRCSPPRPHHRGHAIIEQVIADLKNGPLAHLPSGPFTANAAWLVCAAIAFNLTRAAGALASALPRQRDHRHDPRPADQHPGPARPLRPPAHPAPARRLALGTRPGSDCSRRALHDPTRPRLTTARQGPTGDPQWKSRTDRQLNPPTRPTDPPRSTTSRSQDRRWIQVQLASVPAHAGATMLAVDFFHVDCAVTLRGATSCSRSWSVIRSG